MENQTQQTEQQQTQATTQTVQQTTEQKQPDLITRVSQFKKEETQQQTEQQDTFGLTKEDFDKVNSDPVLSKFYKSMQSDYTKKTQALATERKGLESKVSELSTWSPERVQQLLNDNNFVNAAKAVMETQAPATFEGSQEAWSGLSDTDKAKFRQLEQKLLTIEQQNLQTQKIQQDETLKGRYANYNPQAVDILTAELLAGKVQATREHLWKVYDYEDAVRRAYELGRQDKQTTNTEKVNAASPQGINVALAGEEIKPEQGESNTSFWNRVVNRNLAKVKAAETRK